MIKLTTISIDIDVYKTIQSNLKSFDESPNEVLRRLLGIDNQNKLPIKTESLKNEQFSSQKYYTWKGTSFKVGLKLRKNYKQSILSAEIKENGFYFDGRLFNSPSAAGVYATKTQVDGWKFWEYFDDKKNQWQLIDNLRNNYY